MFLLFMYCIYKLIWKWIGEYGVNFNKVILLLVEGVNLIDNSKLVFVVIFIVLLDNVFWC